MPQGKFPTCRWEIGPAATKAGMYCMWRCTPAAAIRAVLSQPTGVLDGEPLRGGVDCPTQTPSSVPRVAGFVLPTSVRSRFVQLFRL